MTILAPQVTVADYAKWRATFEKHKQRRIGAGIADERVFRNRDAGSEVLAWADVADVAKARQAATSQETRTAMQEGGVIGLPKIPFIEYDRNRRGIPR